MDKSQSKPHFQALVDQKLKVHKVLLLLDFEYFSNSNRAIVYFNHFLGFKTWKCETDRSTIKVGFVVVHFDDHYVFVGCELLLFLCCWF